MTNMEKFEKLCRRIYGGLRCRCHSCEYHNDSKEPSCTKLLKEDIKAMRELLDDFEQHIDDIRFGEMEVQE